MDLHQRLSFYFYLSLSSFAFSHQVFPQFQSYPLLHFTQNLDQLQESLFLHTNLNKQLIIVVFFLLIAKPYIFQYLQTINNNILKVLCKICNNEQIKDNLDSLKACCVSFLLLLLNLNFLQL